MDRTFTEDDIGRLTLHKNGTVGIISEVRTREMFILPLNSMAGFLSLRDHWILNLDGTDSESDPNIRHLDMVRVSDFRLDFSEAAFGEKGDVRLFDAFQNPETGPSDTAYVCPGGLVENSNHDHEFKPLGPPPLRTFIGSVEVQAISEEEARAKIADNITIHELHKVPSAS